MSSAPLPEEKNKAALQMRFLFKHAATKYCARLTPRATFSIAARLRPMQAGGFDQPARLETVLSIQSWTCLLISRGSRPAGSIGGPITTRTVPAFFIHPRRGQ